MFLFLPLLIFTIKYLDFFKASNSQEYFENINEIKELLEEKKKSLLEPENSELFREVLEYAENFTKDIRVLRKELFKNFNKKK